MGNIASWGSCSQQYKNLEQNDDIAISTKDSLCNHYFQFEQGMAFHFKKNPLYTWMLHAFKVWIKWRRKCSNMHGQSIFTIGNSMDM